MIALNSELFKKYIQEEKPVLVEFWAPWCVHCRRIASAMEKIADQYKDELVVSQVNIDDEPALSESERIELVPTLVIYKNGKDLGSIVAPESKAKIEEFIKETLGK